MAFVTTVTIDLGPSLRQLAEKGGAAYLKRDFTIGRLSIRLLTGTFVVENLRIGGLEKADRPFLVAKTIEVSMSFSALLHREVLVDSVVMSDWQMVVETWAGGKHSFPKFTRDSKQPPGPKRFTTTVAYVLAQRGQFTFEDHDVPWSTVARNIEVVVSEEPRLRWHGADSRTAPSPSSSTCRCARTCAAGSRSTAPTCGSRASTCCRMAPAPTSRARSTWRTGPSRRGT